MSIRGNIMVVMYSELDPKMLPLYLFSPVTRHPSFSQLTWTWKGGSICCERGEQIRPITTCSTHLRPSVLWGVRTLPLSPLSSSACLTLPPSPYKPPLPPILSQTGWALGRDPPCSTFLQTPPTLSDSSSWVNFCKRRVAPAFLQPVTPFCWWYTAWSGMFSVLSSLFVFLVYFFWICRLVWSAPLRTENYWLTQNKHLHWNNCDLLLSFIMPIFFFNWYFYCHLDLTLCMFILLSQIWLI